MLERAYKKVFDILDYLNLDKYAVKVCENCSDNFQWTPYIELEREHEEHTFSSQNNKHILFPLFIPSLGICIRLFQLAYAFKCRGYTPIVVYNHKTLSSRYDSESDTLRKHRYYRYIVEFFSDEFSVRCISIDDIIRKGELPTVTEIEGRINRSNKDSIDHLGIDISDAALASTRKSLRRYSIDFDNDIHWKEYVTQVLRGIIIIKTTDTITSEYEFDAIMSWDVSYVHGLLPLRVCESKGIKQYTHESGYHEGTVMYGHGTNRDVSGHFINRKIVERFLNNQLSDDQRLDIQSVMDKRASGNRKYNPNTADANSTMQSQDGYTVGIFTHLPWDGALETEKGACEGYFEWLDSTINIGRDLDETQFIIKIHPAEKIRGTNQSTAQWIKSNYPNLPPNFSILPADTDVDTYKIFDILDAGVVYATTTGLEMSYNGIPVVTGGYPPYYDFNITFDPKNPRDYENLLRNINNITQNKHMQKRARRFAYLLFISKQFEFPYLDEFFSDSDGTVTLESEYIIKQLDIVIDLIAEDMEVIDLENNTQ
jgi:hypothetical protein